MSRGLFVVDLFLHDTILVDTNGSQGIQGLFIARIDTVEDHSDNDLLPGSPTFIPEFGFFEVNDIPHIFHDTMQGSGSQNSVLIVICDGNQ